MVTRRTSEAAGGAVQAGPEQPLRVAADVLLKGRRELIILHNADEYRLRVTSNGKLILTK